MEKYDNGEVVTKERMEDEDWYDDYQMLMEIGLMETDKNVIISNFQKEWNEIYGESFVDLERLDRWASLMSERMTEMFASPEYQKMLELEKEQEW